jgi:hypothetical protein
MSSDNLQYEDFLRAQGCAWHRHNRGAQMAGSTSREQFTRCIAGHLSMASHVARSRLPQIAMPS